MPHRPIDRALIDGDVLTYLSGFGAERVLYKLYLSDEDAAQDKPALISSSRKEIDAEAAKYDECIVERSMEQDPIEYALHKCKLILEKIAGHTGATDLDVYLSGDGNFRKDIATYRKYKGNRDKSKRPQWYHAIREYMTKYWGATTITGEEADDVLGIEQVKALGNDECTIICSTDKDLLQIPGLHYNLTKEEVIEQHPSDAEYIFYSQIITGDSTDNITGCPGLGKKAVEKWLGSEPAWDKVIAAYNYQLNKKLPKDMQRIELGGRCLMYQHHTDESDVIKTVEDFALEMAQLVYIRKQPEEIWTP